jgi:hypothetical protein
MSTYARLALTDRSATFAPLRTLPTSRSGISRKPDAIMGRAAGKVERSRAAGKRSKWDHRDISSQATAPHKDRMGTPEFGPELTAAKTINPARGRANRNVDHAQRNCQSHVSYELSGVSAYR